VRTVIALALITLFHSAALAAENSTVSIKVTADGFEPREIKLERDRPTTLIFTRVTDATCITSIDIPAENVRDVALPLNKAVKVTVQPKSAGVEKFYCSAMKMGNGRLIVSD
jgi:plastocyanin domain-containing protein